MKCWRILKADLYRAVTQVNFVVAVLLFGMLCFTAEGYAEHGASMAVLELALFHQPEEISNKFQLSNYSLFLSGIGAYNLMFSPIIAAIPSIPNFCRERRCGYARLVIPRCGITQRCLSLHLSALISGGLTILTGYGLYGLFCWFLFPDPTEEMTQWLSAPAWSGVLSQLAGAFFFGMVAVLLPILLSGVSKNTYFVLCASFALFYTYCNFLDTLSNRLFYNGQLERSFRVMQFYPTSVFQCFFGYKIWRLAMWGVIAVLVFGFLRLSMGRRFDKGA